MLASVAAPVFNGLLAFYPLAKILGTNPHLFGMRPDWELWLLAGWGGVVSLILEIVRARERSLRFAATFHLGVFLLFSWNVYQDLVGYGLRLGLVWFFLAWGAALAAAWRLMRSRGKITLVAGSLACAAAVPWAQAVSHLAARPRATREAALSSHHHPRAGLPNFYLIVMDAMVSPRFFLEELDGSPGAAAEVRQFLKIMEGMGYDFLPDSWSSYGTTLTSMPSFFHMDFIRKESALTGRLYRARRHGLVGSRFAELLRRSGYKVGSWSGHGDCPAGLDFCFPGYRAYSGIVNSLLAQTPLGAVLDRLNRGVFEPLGMTSPGNLLALVLFPKIPEIDDFLAHVRGRTEPDSGRFFYAHFIAAHPKCYLDSRCALRWERYASWTADVDEPSYGADYRCMLRKVMEIGLAIRQSDPRAQVVILADHGVGAFLYALRSMRAQDRRQIAASFNVLALAKLDEPCRNRFLKARTHVNKARAIGGCLDPKAALPPLPETLATDNLDGWGTYNAGIDIPIPAPKRRL